MTACGMVSGWRNSSLTLVASLVTPAMPENSPADSVVGTETWRTVGGRRASAFAQPVEASTVVTSLARQSWTALAPSVIEPPPSVTIRSALASRAWAAAAMTAERGECAGILSKVPTHLLPSARRTLVDLVGLAVERAAHHQEDALGAVGFHHLGDRLGGRLAVVDFFHVGENDAARCQHCVSSLAFIPPQRSWGGGPQGRRGHESTW